LRLFLDCGVDVLTHEHPNAASTGSRRVDPSNPVGVFAEHALRTEVCDHVMRDVAFPRLLHAAETTLQYPHGSCPTSTTRSGAGGDFEIKEIETTVSTDPERRLRVLDGVLLVRRPVKHRG
jgi:hypothetical protein